MKVLITLSVLIIFSYPTENIFAGIGGSEGGSGKLRWKVATGSGTTVDWPLVRLNENRSYEINELCALNNNTMRTLNKYELHNPKKGSIFNSKAYVVQYKTMDRVFDEANCFVAWDPKCDFAGQYIGTTVSLPIYQGAPKATRDGIESIKEFVMHANLKKVINVKLPRCQ